MLDAIVPTALEDVSKADEVAVNVGERILDRVPDSSLCGEVYDALRLVLRERVVDCRPVCEIRPKVSVSRMVGVPRSSGKLC